MIQYQYKTFIIYEQEYSGERAITVPTIYVSREAPVPGELTIYPTVPGAKAVFNAADAGKIWAGTYSWIEV